MSFAREGFVFIAVAALIAAGTYALALNRRFQIRNPGKRADRWGYFLSIVSVIAGVALSFMIESGVAAGIVCVILYSGLAWFSSQRRHWAWIALTVFSFNPIVWIFNLIYFWRRWAEDSVVTAST